MTSNLFNHYIFAGPIEFLYNRVTAKMQANELPFFMHYFELNRVARQPTKVSGLAKMMS